MKGAKIPVYLAALSQQSILVAKKNKKIPMSSFRIFHQKFWKTKKYKILFFYHTFFYIFLGFRVIFPLSAGLFCNLIPTFFFVLFLPGKLDLFALSRFAPLLDLWQKNTDVEFSKFHAFDHSSPAKEK